MIAKMFKKQEPGASLLWLATSLFLFSLYYGGATYWNLIRGQCSKSWLLFDRRKKTTEIK